MNNDTNHKGHVHLFSIKRISILIIQLTFYMLIFFKYRDIMSAVQRWTEMRDIKYACYCSTLSFFSIKYCIMQNIQYWKLSKEFWMFSNHSKTSTIFEQVRCRILPLSLFVTMNTNHISVCVSLKKYQIVGMCISLKIIKLTFCTHFIH